MNQGPAIRQPKLLDQLRTRLRLKHYSWATEKAYVKWVERYLRFHKDRNHGEWIHPAEIGKTDVSRCPGLGVAWRHDDSRVAMFARCARMLTCLSARENSTQSRHRRVPLVGLSASGTRQIIVWFHSQVHDCPSHRAPG